MISNQNLDFFINQLDKIIELADQHKLDNISLLKPRYSTEKKLVVVISRKNELLPLMEFSQIKLSLYDLLKIDYAQEDLFLKDKALFNEEYFEMIYSDMFDIKKGVSRAEAIDFLNKKLGFNYAPVSSVEPSQKKQKQAEKSNDSSLNDEKKQTNGFPGSSKSKSKLFSSAMVGSLIPFSPTLPRPSSNTDLKELSARDTSHSPSDKNLKQQVVPVAASKTPVQQQDKGLLTKLGFNKDKSISKSPQLPVAGGNSATVKSGTTTSKKRLRG
jgi:hypothetical protein